MKMHHCEEIYFDAIDWFQGEEYSYPTKPPLKLHPQKFLHSHHPHHGHSSEPTVTPSASDTILISEQPLLKSESRANNPIWNERSLKPILPLPVKTMPPAPSLDHDQSLPPLTTLRPAPTPEETLPPLKSLPPLAPLPIISLPPLNSLSPLRDSALASLTRKPTMARDETESPTVKVKPGPSTSNSPTKE